jgi:hypothetical protein
MKTIYNRHLEKMEICLGAERTMIRSLKRAVKHLDEAEAELENIRLCIKQWSAAHARAGIRVRYLLMNSSKEHVGIGRKSRYLKAWLRNEARRLGATMYSSNGRVVLKKLRVTAEH